MEEGIARVVSSYYQLPSATRSQQERYMSTSDINTINEAELEQYAMDYQVAMDSLDAELGLVDTSDLLMCAVGAAVPCTVIEGVAAGLTVTACAAAGVCIATSPYVGGAIGAAIGVVGSGATLSQIHEPEAHRQLRIREVGAVKKVAKKLAFWRK